MIADLFVKLGLKSDEYTKGLDNAQKKSEGFGSSIGNIFKQIGSALGLESVADKFGQISDGIKSFIGNLTGATGAVKTLTQANGALKAAQEGEAAAQAALAYANQYLTGLQANATVSAEALAYAERQVTIASTQLTAAQATLSTATTAVATASTFTARAMAILKIALISTGIGALIVAIGSLVAYFTQTERGAEKVERAMAGVSAVFRVIIDRASLLGEALVKMFSGDFAGGWDKMKASMQGIGKEMALEGKAAMDLKKRYQDLEDKERELITVNEERRAKIAQLRLDSRDESIDALKRQQGLVEAQGLISRVFQDEKAIAIEKAAIMKEQIALGEVRDDDLLKLAELQKNIISQDTQQATELKGLSREIKMVNKQVEDQIRIQKELEKIMQNPPMLKAIGGGKVTTEREYKTSFQTTGEDITKQQKGLIEPTLDLKGIEESKAALGEQLNTLLEPMAQFNTDLNNLIKQGLSEALGVFTNGLIDLFSGDFNAKDFGLQLLGVIGKFMIELGTLMLLTGLGLEALQASINTMNPVPAIIGGGLLIAAGAGISALSKKGLSKSGGSSGGYSGASGYSASSGMSSAGNMFDGKVVFEVRGDTLKGVLSNTDRKNKSIR